MKNVVHYVTRQYMKENSRQTGITFLGIVCMVMLMTCVFVGKDTAVGYLVDVGSRKAGKWHIACYDITKSQKAEIEALGGIEKTAISVDYGITDFPLSANKERSYLSVKAYQASCFDWMNIELVEGRLPEKSDEIVLSEAVLSDGAEITLGDKISAKFFLSAVAGTDYEEIADSDFEESRDYTGEGGEFQVVGVIKPPNYESEDAEVYTAITFLPDDKAETLDRFNMLMMLNSEGHKGMNDTAYSSALYDIVEKGEGRIEYNNYVLAFTGDSSYSTFNMLEIFLSAFFSGLVMFVSVILIYNVFNISFEERSWYLGLLSSIGATGKQKRSSVYYEAFHLLLFALPTGIGIGLLVVKLGMLFIRRFLDQIMNLGMYVENIGVSLHITGKALLLTVLLSVVTVLVSALFPAWKITRVGPIGCIRGEGKEESRQYAMKRKRLQSAERLLAANVITRQKKKTRAIVAAAVSFMVILVVSAFGSSGIKRAVAEKMENSRIKAEYDYKLIPVGATLEEYERAKQKITNTSGIAKVVEWYEGSSVGTIPSKLLSAEYWSAFEDIARQYGEEQQLDFLKEQPEYVSITGVDEETFHKLASLSGCDSRELMEGDIPEVIVLQDRELSTDNCILGENLKRSRYYDIEHAIDAKAGDILPVSIYSVKKEGEVEFPLKVAGFSQTEQAEKCGIIPFDGCTNLIVSTDTGRIICEMEQDVETGEYCGMVPGIQIYLSEDNPAMLSEIRQAYEDSEDFAWEQPKAEATLQEAIVKTVDVLLFCFVALTSIICFCNLFNSIRGRIQERGREFAILESIGMTRDQILKMLLYENIPILTKSIIYVAVIAGGLCWLIRYGIWTIFGPIRLRIPWIWIGAAIGIIIFAVAGLTVVCYRRRQETILERIRRESV